MGECERKGKWIGGCKFEPVYDTSPSDFSALSGEQRVSLSFVEKLRSVTYRGSICKRCGKIVNAPTPSEASK
jgi:hypothetical protein